MSKNNILASVSLKQIKIPYKCILRFKKPANANPGLKDHHNNFAYKLNCELLLIFASCYMKIIIKVHLTPQI